MDFLKAELATKRKALEQDANRPSKYMRRGELEKLKEEQERQRRMEEEKAKQEADAKAKSKQVESLKVTERSASRSISPVAPPAGEASSSNPSASFNISNEEAIRRLRAKGQPIRLFGESDKDRRLRLRALELIEENDASKEGGGGLNDFKRALAGMEEGIDAKEIERRMLAGKNSPAPGGADTPGSDGDAKGKKADKAAKPKIQEVLDLSLVQKDPNALYPIIYRVLKDVLNEWAEAMDQRPDAVKRSTQGKLAAATQVTSADNLKPLFKMLRQRNLPADVLPKLAEIVHHMQKRQYQRANDAYLRLSIGNAAWPIGVTMVGIHERSAREKISSDQVAHVLNDEVSRKYIQSVKRLLTFHQTKYPPDDISQLMG